MYVSSGDVVALIMIIFPAIIYPLLFLYSWKNICTDIKEMGRDFTRLYFVGKILSIDFLAAFGIYVFAAIYEYVTTSGSEYGGEFAVTLFSIFALFIYIVQAGIIFVVTLLIFPFVKNKLVAIRANTQSNSVNLTQSPHSLFITQATKILLGILVIIGTVVYFLFYLR